MDAFLICPETKKSIWLGKAVRLHENDDLDQVEFYHQGPSGGVFNYEDPLLNKVLWKFLAEHANKELRVVADGDYNDDEYERVPTSDIEAELYVEGWPKVTPR